MGGIFEKGGHKMTLINLLNVIADEQTIRIMDRTKTIYTGELEEWDDDLEAFKDWKVTCVHVGIFGTLTINIEK